MNKNLWHKITACASWLLIWQIASTRIAQEMLLASPLAVGRRLAALIPTDIFWRGVLFSLSRVGLGFLLAFAIGAVLAALAYRLRVIEIFFDPFMGIVKAAPVVSYIILLLLFMPSSDLPMFCALLMALPVIYTNLLGGLKSTDKNLLEMAAAYRMGARRKAIYIYFPQLMPYLLAACSLSLGLCWKAGIAAEVIGLPLGSIGEQIYRARIFLDTASLLAWTVVVVAISFVFEKAFLALLRRLSSAFERL
jgi:NitT/TauT family transport system permease protein